MRSRTAARTAAPAIAPATAPAIAPVIAVLSSALPIALSLAWQLALHLVLSVAGAPMARAVPRYAMQYNQSCSLCHVNPTGGGARSLFGAQFFAHTDLAMKRLEQEELDRTSPLLTDQVQVGFDARTMYYGTDVPSRNSFLQMQGDLYLNVLMSPRWSVLFDKGLYDDFELMAIGHVLPATGYVKVGRFTPPYGMRLADHKAFVRERQGLDYRWKESGVEIGFHPERASFALAITNGTIAFEDQDEGKAVTGRIDGRGRIGDLRLWLGATGRWNTVSAGDDETLAGAYAGTALGPMTVLAELGVRDSDARAMATFVEISYRAMRGVTLRAEHDFHDPDLDHESGAENMFVIGAEIVPAGYLQLIPNLRFHDLAPEEAREYVEAEIQAHFFY